MARLVGGMAPNSPRAVALKLGLRRLARKLGYDVTPFTPKWHAVPRRRQLMNHFGIDVVLDVGANKGQFGRELRDEFGFEGRICSFEPTPDAFRVLQALATDDPLWEARNVALGDTAGRATMNIAANSESSSLLDMLPAHELAAPESRFIGVEDVRIDVLDEIFDEVIRPGANVYLKIDTQGFEGKVLRGAERSLPAIDTVQVEMALTPLYAGGLSFVELCSVLLEKGYAIVGLEPGFADPRTGRLLQVDGIFHRDA